VRARAWLARPPLALLLPLGLLGAALVLLLPPLAAALVPLVAACLWLVTVRPELGVLGVLAYTSTVVKEEVMPLVPVGAGSLHLSDVLLAWLLAVLAWRVLVSRTLRLVPTPLDVPILLLVGVSVVSTLWGAAEGAVPFRTGVRDLRPMLYYLLFFPAVHLVRGPEAAARLWLGVLVLAGLTALSSLLQAAVGPDLALLPGRVEDLYTAGTTHDGIVRAIPPGSSLMLLALVLTGTALAWGGGGADTRRKLALLGLLALGLILTYTRMLWVAAALALIGAWLVVGGERRARLSRRLLTGAALGAAVVVGVLLAAPDSGAARALGATLERFATLFDASVYARGDRDVSTFEERAVDIEYALPHLLPPSLIGIGLGAPFRPCLPIDSDAECANPTYVHNGPVAVLLKLGVVGLGALAWLVIAALARGLARWRGAPAPWGRLLVLGCTLALGAVTAASLMEPYWLLWPWTPVLALMLAGILYPVGGAAPRQRLLRDLGRDPDRPAGGP
jgi:hypothetical protein